MFVEGLLMGCIVCVEEVVVVIVFFFFDEVLYFLG